MGRSTKKGRISITRNQYVLDFSNPAVVNNIFEQMQKVITETNLDYVKWDLNRSITEAFSPYLEKIGLRKASSSIVMYKACTRSIRSC
ncbi:hypothetical protein FC12_GL001036 [Lacticaseibacillus paracasei subsp. tolerans DSM 20258]|nr:hypothetical protein FC12_GL001036 [Lacticaseibacillus paracasei subsp. tolerans DSM 20258]